MIVASPMSASAATITLAAVNGNLYQQTVQNPCIFANNSCQQPNGFASTDVPQQGNPSSWDILSPVYTGAQLNSFLNGGSLFLGLDINQATGQGAQTLTSFSMLKNNVTVDLFTGSAGNVGATNNGNGYADYLLGGFSSFVAGDSIQFRFVFNGANDGPENVFLIAGPPNCPDCTPTPNSTVPEPASMVLLGTGLLAAVRARRKKTS